MEYAPNMEYYAGIMVDMWYENMFLIVMLKVDYILCTPFTGTVDI